MQKYPPMTDTQRRAAAALEEQPYSVDPEATPTVDPNAAGPKRRHRQAGQDLDDPQDDVKPAD